MRQIKKILGEQRRYKNLEKWSEVSKRWNVVKNLEQETRAPIRLLSKPNQFDKELVRINKRAIPMLKESESLWSEAISHLDSPDKW